MVTAQEYLDLCDKQWRKKFDAALLTAELEVKQRAWENAIKSFALVLRRSSNPDNWARNLRRWPAAQVVATTGVATDRWGPGGFWPKLTDALGVPDEPAFHGIWGDAFLDNLVALELPTFDSGAEDVGTKYVGRILMHTGMPTYCLTDYYRVIVERRKKIAGLNPAEFVAWAAARAAQRQLYNVDMPVARFMRYGGDFAVDITDRVFDLLDVVAAGGDGSDVPLPDRFRESAQKFNASGALTARDRSRGDSVKRAQQPQLVIDPFGQGLLLRLPSVGDAPDGTATWVVGLDDSVRRVATAALFPGHNEPAPQTDVPITTQVRMATAALEGHADLQVSLNVVDENDPLLAFGEDGSRLPSGLPLPGRPTWLLFPGEPGDLRLKGNAPVIAESPVPPGWAGWCLLQLDLAEATEVGVAIGRRHPVRQHAAARILVDEPVHGVRTQTGLRVVPSLPQVVLPTGLGEARWEVTLLDGNGDAIGRWTSNQTHAGPDSVWSRVPRPVVGTYTVRVRGPWGRGASRTLEIVEGLDAAFEPKWRRLTERGLQDCTATIRTATGIEPGRALLDLGARSRDCRVKASAEGRARTLVVTPPHMTIAYQSGNSTLQPSIQPLHLSRESVTDVPGTLILDLGHDADPTLHYVVGREVVQTLPHGGGRKGVFRFDLGKLVDTLTVHPQGRLALAETGELPVASIRPARLFSSIGYESGTLVFGDCIDVEGLTALVFATRAPWRGPAVVPISSGRALLPTWLTDAGPLSVLVRIEDPWAPEPIPEITPERDVKLVLADGWVTDGDDESQALSGFLAGVRELPDNVFDLSRVWTARALAASLCLGERLVEVVTALERLLGKNPREALLALPRSRTPANMIPFLLVRSGIVWADLAEAHDDSSPPWSLRGALPSTLLSAADGEWSADEVAAAIDVIGDVVVDLLEGRDPFASCGRLDKGAEIFDQKAEEREALVRFMGLVPRGLLSGDSRTMATMAFVRERRNRRLDKILHQSKQLLKDVDAALVMLDDPVVTNAVSARRHPTATGGWKVLPTLSLGLAFAARHAARGEVRARNWLAQQAPVWSDLARIAPDLVTSDLILAELLVSGAAQMKENNA